MCRDLLCLYELKEEGEGVLTLPHPQDVWIRYISSENEGMPQLFFPPLNPLPHQHTPVVEKELN